MKTIIAGLAVAVCASSAMAEAFEDSIRPLVGKFCVECHNENKTKGDLNLARFATMAMVTESVAVWQRAGKRIEAHEMPPQSYTQPTPAERQQLLEWIGKLRPDTVNCDTIASEESQAWYPGYVMSRRLNRSEYENTIRDLFGVPIPVADLFPNDGAGGEGFDNDGSALFLSAIQMEKYVAAADLVVDTIFPHDHYDPIAKVARVAAKAATLDWDAREELRAARERIITVEPGRKVKPRAAAEGVLLDFAERAWRRPVTPEEIDTLLAMYDRGRERGDSWEASIKLGLKAALVSPNFLFLAEPQPQTAGVYPLGDYQLASRLSYFLWGTMPDEELFALAAADALNNEDELKRQVSRMLKDARAAALGEQFGAQWLGITQLGETSKPDEERFPEFDEALVADMRAEAAMLFNTVVRENRSLLELINADYTFVTERLAALYGLEGVKGRGMQRVQLADARRGGVLGMAAVLTATSHPLRTSPVLRGKWVLEQLLGDRVPPPPPDAGTLPEDDVQPDGLSLRARMELHRKNPDCAACHQTMDPIGFGLENYDPIGRWRDEAAGQPVDAEGVLPSGEKFNGPQELKEILLARKDAFARNIARKMLGYALGRSLTQYDSCVVDKCLAALQAEEYRPEGMFREIVLSHPFRHRYSARSAD